MQTSIIHTFDTDDGGAFAPARAAEALNLLMSSIDEPTQAAVDRGERAPDGLPIIDFRGLRAVRKIRGGAFTAEDAEDFRAYVTELARRHRAKATKLEAEGAPPAFVSAVRDAAAHAERIADDFIAGFREALQSAE